MGSRIRCFWLEDSDRVKIFLRRYVGSDVAKCPERYGYHNASAFLEERAAQRDAEGYHTIVDHPRDSGPWPMACPCGYVFEPGDPWQVHQHSIYRRTDTGELMTLEEAPAGAMWNAWWIADRRTARGPGTWVGEDGVALVVKTPAGEWNVDAPSKGGGGWTRTGAPPDVTANPSIVIGDNRYHGFLRAGWLEEC